MKKVYRIFISSVQRLLEEERRILTNEILSFNHHPVLMENGFHGDSQSPPNIIDMKYLEDSDAVVVIMSHLYGEIIGKKTIKNSCPFKDNPPHENCKACYGDKCHLSFTQFEYHYAFNYLEKPVFFLLDENYNNLNVFETKNSSSQENEFNKIKYYANQGENEKFIGTVRNTNGRIYKNIAQFQTCARDACLALSKELDNNENAGLIPVLNESLENVTKKLKKFEDIGIEDVFENQLKAVADYKRISSEDVSDIRILCIRGDSFFIDHEGEWGSVIMPLQCEKTFVLCDPSNEELIKERCIAINKHNVTITIEKYKEKIIRNQDTIKKDSDSNLILHKINLLYRMVFVGNYLYLSHFFDKPASESFVIKMRKNSVLYNEYEKIYDNTIKSSINPQNNE